MCDALLQDKDSFHHYYQHSAISNTVCAHFLLCPNTENKYRCYHVKLAPNESHFFSLAPLVSG